MPRVWIDTRVNSDVAVGGQTFQSLMTGITETRFERMTLLRTIIGLDLARTVHDSGEGSEVLSVGIGIVSQEAFDASAIPEARLNTDYPTRGWVWRAQYRIWGFAADQPAVFTKRIDLDMRSQRKLDNGASMIVYDLEALEGANSTCRVMGLIRQLWLVG